MFSFTNQTTLKFQKLFLFGLGLSNQILIQASISAEGDSDEAIQKKLKINGH